MQDDQDKVTIRINTGLLLSWLKIGGAVAVLVLVYRGGRSLQYSHVSSVTEDLYNGGYHALAYEEVDPHRAAFVGDAEGCRVLLTTYMEDQKFDRLEWGYEACRKNGVSSYEVHLAQARLLLNTGAKADAAALLHDMKDFHRPAINGLLVEVLMSLHREEEASREADEAVKSFPDREGLRVLALRVFAAQQKWADAVRVGGVLKDAAVAGRIRGDVRNLLATAFEKSGDHDSARAILEARPPGRPPAPNQGPGASPSH